MKMRVVVFVLTMISTAACAPLDSTGQVCRLMPELDSSTVALSQAFGDLSTTDAAVLESSLNVLIETIDSLRENPPAAIESSLSTLDRAYREVRVALLNVDYDGAIAVNDLATINALGNLRRGDVIRASASLEKFVESNCRTDFNSPLPSAMANGPTLPTPIGVPGEVEEYPFVVEDEPSSLTAYGYLLVNGRGIELTDQQAECVGRTVSDAAQGISNPDDTTLDALVKQALSKCFSVTTPPKTSVGVPGASSSGD